MSNDYENYYCATFTTSASAAEVDDDDVTLETIAADVNFRRTSPLQPPLVQ